MYPFTERPSESIAAWGEKELLRRMRLWLGPSAPPSPYGMGDDCALLPNPQNVNLITVDALVYGRHFDHTIPADAAGAKLLKRNLSDIAAMGGCPRQAVVALQLAPQTSQAFLEAFTRGLAACALQYGVQLVGGDLSSLPQGLVGSLTLLGYAARPVLRTGGRPGSRIAVTGPLGGSILGRHHRFVPRLAEGQWLASRSEVLSMMDLTDGLAKDLPEMLPAGTAALLAAETFPFSPECRQLAERSGRSLLWHAGNDGEDYELLFCTAPGCDEEAFYAAYQERFSQGFHWLGRIASISDPALSGRLLDADRGTELIPGSGYEHFL